MNRSIFTDDQPEPMSAAKERAEDDMRNDSAPTLHCGCSTDKPHTCVQLRVCMGCGSLTRGSTGVSGNCWARVCQPCKDKADAELSCRVTVMGEAADKIAGILFGAK